MDMIHIAPEHLSSYSKAVVASDFPKEIDKCWLEGLGTKLQIIDAASGRDRFKLMFSGTKYDDGLLGPNGTTPLVVSVQMEAEKKIIVFDERQHGYEALLVEAKEYSEPIFSDYRDNENADLFRIYFCCNSSIDFEDEFDFDENGQTENLRGEFCSLPWLRANAFDYVVLFLENEGGGVTKLLELELA